VLTDARPYTAHTSSRVDLVRQTRPSKTARPKRFRSVVKKNGT